MRVIRTIKALQVWRKQQESKTVRIGFVPTMGALHPGHRSLIQRARGSSELVVVSLFVNPLQFGPKEDFHHYPKPIKVDTVFCRREAVDILFVPSLKDLYPADFQTSITIDRLSRRWEGEHRPTHFHGVATVLTKLMNIVRPDVAFFGQKDYQQFLVINQLNQDLHFNVKVMMGTTIRELDGLAWSSRNQHLSLDQRQQASVLYHALLTGRKAIQDGWRSAKKIQQMMRNHIAEHSSMSVNYLAVCHAKTLEPLTMVKGRVVLLGAIRLGKVRLIDNILVRCPN